MKKIEQITSTFCRQLDMLVYQVLESEALSGE